MKRAAARPMRFGRAGPLRGTAIVPGDKSISHRALILAAMANGQSRVEGLSGGEDVAATVAALRHMGVGIAAGSDGAVLVDGVGTGGLLQPSATLDMGNSGTSTRLLMGLIATHPLTVLFTGDASLSRRPMGRVAEPLRRIGAEIVAAPGDRLPLTLRGINPAPPIDYRLELASAQVKSALLLAGLAASGETRIVEPVPTRDHLERMLPLFGASLRVEAEESGARLLRLGGEARLRPAELAVPRDPSSAAFAIVAALLVPGSELVVPGLCVNPLRTGLFEALERMGGRIAYDSRRTIGAEPIADLVVTHSALQAIEIGPEQVPSMIDEFPIFFVAAALARGTSRASGLAELRVKESDRIAAMVEGLRAIGAEVEESADSIAIHGTGGGELAGGATIASRLDHRIAMAFAVAGLRCAEPLGVDDMSPVDTSFPGFADLIARLQS